MEEVQTKNISKDNISEGNKEKKKVLTQNNITTYEELSEIIEQGNIDWNLFYLKRDYIRTIQNICKQINKNETNITTEQFLSNLYNDIKSTKTDCLYEIMPIYLGACVFCKNYKNVFDLVSTINLCVFDSKNDLFMSKVIKYFYIASRNIDELSKNEKNTPKRLEIGEYHKMLVSFLVTNKCKHSILIVYNILLEWYLLNKVEYIDILVEDIKKNFGLQHSFKNYENKKIQSVGFLTNVDKFEECQFYFYLGYSHLIMGDYHQALKFFDEADILNRKKSMDLCITKCSILSKLLMGDTNLFYDYNKELSSYFAIIGIVKRGEINNLYAYLQNEEFTSGVKLIISRLIPNVLKEGIIKVSEAYSIISFEQINDLFKYKENDSTNKKNKTKKAYVAVKDLSSLVIELVNKGIINSRVEEINGKLFLCKNKTEELNKELSLTDKIRRVINIREFLKKQMEYPELGTLTYERILEEEQEIGRAHV